MFGSLKEKLTNWTSKIKEEVFGKEERAEKPKKASKTQKKDKKKIKKTTSIKTQKNTKTKKQKNKFQETPAEFITGEKKFEQEIEQKLQEKELIEQEETTEKKGFFSKFFKTELTKEKFEELFQELQLTLLQNNVAYEVVEKIKEELSLRVVGKNKPDIKKELRGVIENILIQPTNFIQDIKLSLKEKKPYIIVLVGINGAGKTTAIAKLANLFLKNKLSICLAAADTYRAASIEQLEVHADKLGVPLIKKEYGTDPASVGFEAISYAKKNKTDVVLIDTAGRLNNKDSLMKELEKIIKVSNPDAKIFIGESTTGNDATEQAKTFNESIELTGIILSKADIDEKGGTMISVGYITKKPILFLGTGQEYSNLEVFDKEKILRGLGL
jgi:fused signal recognition particle receptor